MTAAARSLPPAWLDYAALVPQWEAPARVRAFVTGRRGGVSAGAYGATDGGANGLNLGSTCGDDPRSVAINRARLAGCLPASPRWLHQVHGVTVHVARAASAGDGASCAEPHADAAVTAQAGVVLAALTADCLPVLLATARGDAVGVVHAGWRGLAAGVVERSVRALRACRTGDDEVLAWLGPAIGPRAFEVGEEVVRAFCEDDPGCGAAFVAAQHPGKWFADLYRLARARLARVGVTRVGGGGHCTVEEPARFYSHRRQRGGGRMASLIWMERDPR